MSNTEEELEFDFTNDDDEELSSIRQPVVTSVDGVELPDAWGQSMKAMEQVSKQRQSLNMKHGMFANTPMICKGSGCPLSNICSIQIRHRPVYNRCPIEIASIMELYDRYCEELMIGPKDYFDQSNVKILVDIDIKLMRASGQLAIAGDFTQEIVFATDAKGNPFARPELHKATEYEEQLLKQRAKVMNDLNVTRRQRTKDAQVNEASSFASDLMQRAMAAQRKNGVIDMPNMMDVTIIDPSVKTDTNEED